MARDRKVRTVSGRVTERAAQQLQTIARTEGRTVSQVLSRFIEEGLRMQRLPGVVFVDGPRGRRAHVAGTGLDVWEIVALSRAYSGDAARLLKDHPGIARRDLDLADSYARAYPDEIDALIAENEQAEALGAPAVAEQPPLA